MRSAIVYLEPYCIKIHSFLTPTLPAISEANERMKICLAPTNNTTSEDEETYVAILYLLLLPKDPL